MLSSASFSSCEPPALKHWQTIPFVLRPTDALPPCAAGQVWSDAAGQIFFTLGATLGIMTAYGSYAPKSTNMFVNNVLIGYINCGTSLFAGCAPLPACASPCRTVAL